MKDSEKKHKRCTKCNEVWLKDDSRSETERCPESAIGVHWTKPFTVPKKEGG